MSVNRAAEPFSNLEIKFKVFKPDRLVEASQVHVDPGQSMRTTATPTWNFPAINVAVYYFREVHGRSTTPTKPTLSEDVSITGGNLSDRKFTSFFAILQPISPCYICL